MIFALSNVPWTSIIRDVFVSVWDRNGFAILKGRCAIWGTIIQRASLFELRAGLANWCNLSLLWTVLSFCDLYSLFKRKRLGKKSRFFLELNEMPNKNGRFATGFVRHFLFYKIQCCSRQDLIQIYGQSVHFWWFVRKQNAFYGQTAFFRWFVRKF